MVVSNRTTIQQWQEQNYFYRKGSLARADKYSGEFVLEREWNIEVEPAN
jgi:hypothetical protein